ncbi:MAG TPA: alpha/beta fold hydrolase [Streptosporangiaceae bacterium]|nr:alpha/beta fold hydrolase [Streptosporangiaceae bacterium]
MVTLASPAEMLAQVLADIEREAVRTRNGVKYVAGIGRPRVGQTPKDVVWRRGKVELWRYRSNQRRWRPPVLIVYSLVSRSYVLDLSPDNTFVGRLLDAGLDVFLIDWGVPDGTDADNSFETYADYFLPQAIRALLAETGSDSLTVLGYCSGGDLALFLAARHPELPIRNLITVGTPVDFAELGMFSRLFCDGRLDAEALIDGTGNVPPDNVRNAFRVLKPTGDINSYVLLWENLLSDEQLAAYQAMGQWTREHVPFPGAAFRQLVQMMRDNALINDTLVLGGTPVHLADIRCPFLSVLAERDHIAPEAAVAPAVRLVGSADTELIRLPAGHVGLMASRTASRATIPRIVDWIGRHSEEQP